MIHVYCRRKFHWENSDTPHLIACQAGNTHHRLLSSAPSHHLSTKQDTPLALWFCKVHSRGLWQLYIIQISRLWNTLDTSYSNTSFDPRLQQSEWSSFRTHWCLDAAMQLNVPNSMCQLSVSLVRFSLQLRAWWNLGWRTELWRRKRQK